MFIVLLRFAAGGSKAARVMEDHKAGIQRGVADGVFLPVEPGILEIAPHTTDTRLAFLRQTP